jgi:hypothetical protein
VSDTGSSEPLVFFWFRFFWQYLVQPAAFHTTFAVSKFSRCMEAEKKYADSIIAY